MVEGKWLDRPIMILDQAGAMLVEKGFQLRETNDHYTLVWPRFVDMAKADVLDAMEKDRAAIELVERFLEV